VLRVTASYLAGDGWRDTVDTLLAERTSRVAADMSRVEAAGSLALVNLLWALRKLRRAGGDLRLFAVPSRMANLIRELGLEGVLRCHESEQAAVASFDEAAP